MGFYPYNDNLLLDRRKELRHKQTESERLLWKYLRNKKIGFKFFRQYGVKQYILDFYCPERRLAIEIDGYGHRGFEAIDYDKERTGYLNSLDIKVVRFWDTEVLKEIFGVVKRIEEYCNSSSR